MSKRVMSHATRVERNLLLFRSMVDPLWFGREIMGYDRLTAEFHEPIMLDMWARDLRRPLIRSEVELQVRLGMLPGYFLDLFGDGSKLASRSDVPAGMIDRMSGRGYTMNEGECWAREHFKTTVMIARCAKLILLWPLIRISHWHAVEDKAIECSDELGDHFVSNTEFRKLRMEIMPSSQEKNFTTSKGFRLDKDTKAGGGKIRNLYYAAGFDKHIPRERHPTFFPKGAGAEVTGGHSDIGWLDDIVGEKTINDSQMPVIRAWLGKTVAMVVRKDNGFLLATYTPWDEDDVMTDWERNGKLWDCRVHSCWKDEEKTEGVLFSRKHLMRLKNDPQISFAYQMECNRVPDEERRWPKDWDGWCKLKWALGGKGRIFVLSDPAPMGLSLRGDKDRVRGDTGKDWWAISVVRLRVRGDFQDLILLDGAAAQEWSESEGHDEECRLMLKWGTKILIEEDYSGLLFEGFHKAARRHGVQPYYEKDSKQRIRLPRMNELYNKNVKKMRFQRLCDKASDGAVWIADSCPEEFWKGDGEFTGALTQISKWIPRKGGESSLKWDDHADSWAFAMDSKLQQFSPQPAVARAALPTGTDPFGRDRRGNDQGYKPKFTRYI